MENLTFKKKAKQTFGEFMNINNIAALLFFKLQPFKNSSHDFSFA